MTNFSTRFSAPSSYFFWEQASPTTGQVKDRAVAAGNDTRTLSSIAATGFGLTALCISHSAVRATPVRSKAV
jgi:hypothetical protein